MNMGVACHDWCWKKGNVVFLSVHSQHECDRWLTKPLCLFAVLYRTVFYVSFTVVNITVILWAVLTVYLSLCLNFFLCCSCGFCHCWGDQECDGVKILVTLHVNFSHKLLTFFLFECGFYPLFLCSLWFVLLFFVCVLFEISPKCSPTTDKVKYWKNWTH